MVTYCQVALWRWSHQQGGFQVEDAYCGNSVREQVWFAEPR